MPKPPMPRNEEERLKALYKYQILDTPAEETFDSIVAYAAEQFDVPIALISLVDRDRQWFKSCIGLDVAETGRDVAFCAYAILGSQVMIVPDALEDPRFAENPLVTGAPYIRFYAGAPLVTHDGQRIGTLCMIDTQPREFTEPMVERLQYLAKLITVRLQLRLASLNLKESRQHLTGSYLTGD